MTKPLWVALEERRAELQGETFSPVKANLLKQLEIELPKVVAECFVAVKCRDGYHIDLNLPGPSFSVSLKYSNGEAENLKHDISISSLTLRCELTAKEEKRLIKDYFFKWLKLVLPQDVKVCVEDSYYPKSYYLHLELPGGVVSLRRVLHVHEGCVCTSPLMTDSLWRAERSGEEPDESKCFHDFLDAVLYVRGC